MVEKLNKLNYCKICLQTDTRPNINFSDEGICPACSYHDALKNVDWDERFSILQNIVAKHINKSSKYDCMQLSLPVADRLSGSVKN